MKLKRKLASSIVATLAFGAVLFGSVGNQSFDALAGPLNNMFDFKHPEDDKLILNDQTGERK
jgi:hypothetical protein